MTSFDWREFLIENSIPYIERGENCARGNINVNCPFCGNDSKYHLGIDVSNNKGWGCWRSSDHRGKSPVKLVEALLGCSTREAMSIVRDDSITTIDNFDDLIDEWNPNVDQKVASDYAIKWPKNFILPDGSLRWHKPYLDYVRDRGFARRDVLDFFEYYDIRITKESVWRDRVLIPYYSYDELTGWSGRSIKRHPYLRWMALSSNNEDKKGRKSGKTIKHCIGNEKNLMGGGNILILFEGQFDFLKLDYYGKKLGVRAGCLFNTSLSDEQESIVSELTQRFDKVFFVLDDGKEMDSMRLSMRFPDIGQVKVPYKLDDFGEASKLQAMKFAKELLRK